MIQAQALGHLGSDAEVKTINDRQYITFRIASTEKRAGQEETTWISVLASDNPNLLPYLKKGQQVFVSGRMAAKIYQSQQSFGIDISIFATTLQLCGAKRDDTPVTTTSADPAAPQNPLTPITPPSPPNSEDDLPF